MIDDGERRQVLSGITAVQGHFPVLARLLRGLSERGLDHKVSRLVGEVCTAASTGDVVDAHVALLAADDDLVVTSDVPDLRRLLRARGSAAHVQPC